MLVNPPSELPRQFNASKKLFLTADEHYLHANIIKYQARPFSGIEEMNNTLIANSNAIVGQDDHVIHIGDFSFGHKEDLIRILRRLNGKHYILDGSHDKSLEEYFLMENKPTDIVDKFTILPKLFEFTYSGKKITLCHYAMARWWASHHGSLHFFGHSHGNYEHPGRAIDVGVDVQGYTPILIDQAIKLAEKKVAYANHPKRER